MAPEEFERLVQQLRVAVTAPRLEMRPEAFRRVTEIYIREYDRRKREIEQ
jgi:hypothetical protein